MGIFNFFRKNKPPKEVEKVFEKMRLELEGRKLADEAISYRNLGEYNKAFELLRKAIEKYNYKPAITLIGTTAMIKGDFDGAIDWFEVNIKNPPKEEEYLLIEWYSNLGVIHLFKKEDCETACTIFEKALSIPKPSEISDDKYEAMISPIHRDLAIAYLACGQISLAASFARKRLAYDPNCEKSQRVISMCLAHPNELSQTSHLVNRPSCGTVVFSSDGRATQIATGGAVFPSPFQRLIHGTGHILLHMLYDISMNALPEKRGQIQKDIKSIETWAGVKDGMWTNEEDERFARQYELYMLQSKPELKLEPIQGELLDPIIGDILNRYSKKE